MKRFINISITLMMTVCLAGCSFGGESANGLTTNNSLEEGQASLEQNEEQAQETTDVAKEETIDEEDNEVIDETDNQEDTTDETLNDNSEDGSFKEPSIVGIKGDYVYDNYYFGIHIDVPAECTITSEEEIEDLKELTLDVIDNEDYTEYIKKGNTILDFQYKRPNGSDNLTVAIDSAKGAISTALQAEKVANSGSFEMLFESMGFPGAKVLANKIEIDGVSFDGVLIEIPLTDEISMYEEQIYFIVDDYMMDITAAATNKDDVMLFFDDISLIEDNDAM